MHCKSCALLIEEKLKNQPGVIEAKVNFDSQKAVIVYDENKMEKNKLTKIIEEAGRYKAEEILFEENEKTSLSENHLNPKTNLQSIKQCFSNHSFSLGLLLGFSLISTLFNILMWGLVNDKIKIIIPQETNSKTAISTPPSPPENKVNNNQLIPPSPSSQPPVVNFNITPQDHVRGNFDAPITLVEFSDFECPFCGRHFPTLNKILSDYQGKVRLVYKHFPLGFHPNAQKAAEASECASEQGKFWEYHDKIFENQASGLSLDKFKQWVKELGLNSSKFNDCLDSGKYAQKVQADYQEGVQKGVNGTPATFVNGQLVSGALPYEAFKQIIDNLLKQ
jgi:protein-disulfide isomerase/copper chaperone CopZ